jgi:RHS repeat-associated protein
LGSAKYNQNNAAQSFYPYGEDRGTAEPNDSLKFATYTRDAATGLDYADQRYYASNFGRFMSPDPYKGSAGPKDPRSWNRYSYTRGDPANDNDPEGLTCVAQGGFWVDNGDGRGCDQNGQPTGDLTALLNDPTFVDDVWGAFEEAEQSDPADECTVSQYIFMDCDSSQAMAAAGARGWWTAYGVGSWWAAAQLVGQAGEAVVSKIIGLARNVGPGRFTIPNGNSFVVPDFVNQATETIYEVKNMTAPGVSIQLTAMASWAQQQGWNFTLYLNSNANVSANFQAWAAKYGVNIQYFNWP